MTAEHEGRERIADRDRQADVGERAEEYREGEVTDTDDPLARARAEAVEESTGHATDQPPGVTPLEEEWQREKQMAGQDADDPGLPESRRGSSANGREDPGTGTDSDRMGKPERADELPDSGEVTQG